MKTIPNEYVGRGDQKLRNEPGYFFQLVFRHGKYAIYRKHAGNYETFELVIVRQYKKDRIISGVVVSHAGDEYLPSSNEWGRFGWSFQTLEKAIGKAVQKLEMLQKHPATA